MIRNASVLDVEAGTYSVADVVSIDGKISNIGPDAEAPSGARVIDGTGKFVIPGLIDCHVHVVASSADFRSLTWTPASYVYAQTARIMGQMLRRGFTTVRDLSGADFGLAMAQQEGLLDGPKIHFCGHALSQTGGHGDMRLPGEDHEPNGRGCCGIGRVADGVDAVRAAARDELRKGAHHIKIMASGGVSSPTDRIDSTQYSMEEMRAAVEEAEAANRYVAAHAYTARAINRALEAGVRSIEHGNLLDDESLRLFLEKDAFLVPTLVTYWALKEEGRSFGLTEEMWAKVDSVLTSGLEAIARAHEAGVKMAFGTDLLGRHAPPPERTVPASGQGPAGHRRHPLGNHDGGTAAGARRRDRRRGAWRGRRHAGAVRRPACRYRRAGRHCRPPGRIDPERAGGQPLTRMR